MDEMAKRERNKLYDDGCDNVDGMKMFICI